MKMNSYAKAGSYYLIGNLFNKGIAFLTIPIFTRILTTYDYGVINTYNAWVGIVSIVLGLALHMGIRSAFNDYLDKIEDYMSSTIFFSLISGSIFSLIIILIFKILDFNLGLNLPLLIMCLFHSLSSALISDYDMYLMMKVYYRKRTLLMILPNLLSTISGIVLILFVYEDNKYLGKIVPNFIVYIIFALIIVFSMVNRSKPILQKGYIKHGLNISLPIVAHGLSLGILSQSDRIMLTSLVGEAETGVYSLIYNFSMIVTVISGSLEGIWVPWFTKKLKVRDIKSINLRVSGYIDVMTYATIGVILISPEILKIMAPSNYWYGIPSIPIIVLSGYIIFLYTIYVNVEHFHKKTKGIAANTIIAAITNIGLNFILIPKYGLFGATFATLASYIISLIMHYRSSKKLEVDLFSIKLIIKPIILVILSCIIFYLFLDFSILRWLSGILLIILFINKLLKYKKNNNL